MLPTSSPFGHCATFSESWSLRISLGRRAKEEGMNHAIAFTQLVQLRPSNIKCGLHLSKTSFLVNSTCPYGGVGDARRRQHQYTDPLRRRSIHISSVTQTTSQSSDTQSPSPPPSLPASTATYVDPQTGSTVHIIGCVHGSFVSAG